MLSQGARPDHLTLPLVNRAIGSSGGAHPRLGQTVHALGIRLGFAAADAFFLNTMIDAYAKCRRTTSARHLFDEMRHRDVVSWTSMISAYERAGMTHESFALFGTMREEGKVEPNSVTLVVILQACFRFGCPGSRAVAAQLSGLTIKNGFWNAEIIGNAMLTLFAKMGSTKEAEKIFQGIEKKSNVAWNVMISMHLSSGNASDVISCFDEMRRHQSPTHETLSMVLSALASLEDRPRGKKVHSHAIKAGLIDNVLRASLLRFYFHCGELEKSVQLFEEEDDSSNCFAWSVMTSGLTKNGCFKEAVTLFRRMQTSGIDPDPNVLREMVVACTQVGALRSGKGIHGYLTRHGYFGFGGDVSETEYLETSLMNMYAKCGSIQMARTCFDRMASRDVIAWSSIIEAYSTHGIAPEALNLFHQMEAEGIKPNAVTFLSLLSACSHTGLVHEACDVFFSMINVHELRPGLDHCTCIIDLLGRHGRIGEAVDLIHSMDSEPDGRTWGALLASSLAHSNAEAGVYAARKVLELEPQNVGYRVLLSNLHARFGNWCQVESSRDYINRKRIRGVPGWSFVEVNGEVHMFTAGDRSCQGGVEIFEILGMLSRQMEDTTATNWS